MTNNQEPRTHVNAAIIAGIVGLIWLSAIIAVIVAPPPEVPAGGEVAVLKGDSITLSMIEWGFNQLKKGGPVIEIKAGTEVKFTITNDGKNFHGWQILRDGEIIAGWEKDDTIAPGESRTITVRLDEPGEYIYICPVAGHREKGMVGVIRVVE